jgi:hypothetical protein
MNHQEYRAMRLLETAAREAGQKLGFNGDPVALSRVKIGTLKQYFYDTQDVFFAIPAALRRADKDTTWLMANSVVMNHDESCEPSFVERANVCRNEKPPRRYARPRR